MTATLARPLTLPGGSTLVNRIAKSAMSEQLGTKESAPDDGVVKLYETWGQGGAGLLITGNVMIDRRHLGEPGNIAVEDARHRPTLARWAEAAQRGGAQCWVQLNHPGRQAPRIATREPVAAAAGGLEGLGGAFLAPRALTHPEL
jgi:2,4-dienoyl-CoA reductase-like NADH-dependent reductase (Old Yellow Enzyme family)